MQHGSPGAAGRTELNPDPLDFIEGNLIVGAIVQLRGARRLVRSDLLRVL